MLFDSSAVTTNPPPPPLPSLCLSLFACDPGQPAPQQQQQQQGEKWQLPKREKREKGPAPVRGEVQQVRWNPEHKFLHLRNGEPIVPFKELLKGKNGDERKRLLYEIAMDVKEWRRWRHAKAVAKAAKRRAKEGRPQTHAAGGEQSSKGSGDPEQRWRERMDKRRKYKTPDTQQSKWGGRGSLSKKKKY